jgi:hypothetical protein
VQLAIADPQALAERITANIAALRASAPLAIDLPDDQHILDAELVDEREGQLADVR